MHLLVVQQWHERHLLHCIVQLHTCASLLPCLPPTYPPTTTHPLQVRVVIGGVQIRPGDWVYADLDGVLVSKEELAL